MCSLYIFRSFVIVVSLVHFSCVVASVVFVYFVFWCFKQKTAYEMRISDWSSDVCSSDLPRGSVPQQKRYADENPGVPVQDIVTDIGPVSSQANERLGYPTQKPVPLLDRIIQASSNPGDVVFDPFCGCGTTIYSAVKNERRWIECEIAILPIQMVKNKLAEPHRLFQGNQKGR